MDGQEQGRSWVARTFSLAPHNPRQRNWRELWHGGGRDASREGTAKDGSMDGQDEDDVVFVQVIACTEVVVLGEHKDLRAAGEF